MVFSGTDLSAIFAAAEANDQTLTEGIWTAHNGDQLVTYAQCRRRYNSYKKKREADAEEEATPATPAAGKKRSRELPPASARWGTTTQTPVRDCENRI